MRANAAQIGRAITSDTGDAVAALAAASCEGLCSTLPGLRLGGVHGAMHQYGDSDLAGNDTDADGDGAPKWTDHLHPILLEQQRAHAAVPGGDQRLRTMDKKTEDGRVRFRHTHYGVP